MKRTSAVAVLLSVLALLLGAMLVNSAAAAPSDSLTGDAGTFSYDNAPNIASGSVESLAPPLVVVLPKATVAGSGETGASPLRLTADLVAPNGLADDVVIVRGGQSPVPAPGEVFSGAYGSTIDDAAAYVPHRSIRTSTVGDITQAGGTVDVVPELTRSGVLNTRHVDICLGSGTCPFPNQFIPNPVPKSGRIQ